MSKKESDEFNTFVGFRVMRSQPRVTWTAGTTSPSLTISAQTSSPGARLLTNLVLGLFGSPVQPGLLSTLTLGRPYHTQSYRRIGNRESSVLSSPWSVVSLTRPSSVLVQLCWVLPKIIRNTKECSPFKEQNYLSDRDWCNFSAPDVFCSPRLCSYWMLGQLTVSMLVLKEVN